MCASSIGHEKIFGIGISNKTITLMHDDATQPTSKAKNFAFLNFLCSKLRGCGKGNKVATKTKSGNIKALLYSDSIIDLEKNMIMG